jgi:hypothetical protein
MSVARKQLGGCLGLLALLLALMVPNAAQADFGLSSLSVSASEEDGSPVLQAGSHPYEFTTAFALNTDAGGKVEGRPRELIFDLPPGMVGDPLAVPRCSASDFEGALVHCPGNTQVGIADVFLSAGLNPPIKVPSTPIYNLTPAPGAPASFGTSLASVNGIIEASLRSSDYGVSASDITLPSEVELQSVALTIWGAPVEASHDPDRQCFLPGDRANAVRDCASDSPLIPFLTMPTSCTGPLKWTLSINSIEEPETFQTASVQSIGSGGQPAGLHGCEKLPFAPSIGAQPESSVSDSPTGLHFNLHLPKAPVVAVGLEPLDEVQLLQIESSPVFRLAFEGKEETEDLPFNASAAEVQEALEGLPSIGNGSVAVSSESPGSYLVAFQGALSQQNLPLIKIKVASGQAEVTVTQQGRQKGELGATGEDAGLATAHLKDAVVVLPRGLVLNPSAADGRTGCPLGGPEGINLPGSGEPAQSEPAKCPDASKVGTVTAKSPLLDHPVTGTVYLARQSENPFGSLLAIYVALSDPQTGVVVKLAGKVEPDPITGQLRTTFRNNPQLPVEEFDFNFFGGPRAALTTPPTCGTYTTTADLTPWSAPEGADAFPSDPFSITRAPTGPCPASEAQMPNNPSFEAGTATPLAGAYSPFVMRLSRENGSQRLSALNVTLPPGVSANFTGVAECSDAQIAQAAARGNPGQGILEQQSPSCPAGSQIGVVNVGAGSGSPVFVQGNVYLAGPYKGAPFSLAIITPGVTGPFDIGTVVVRAALYVNEETGQGTVKSDPLPQILQGIPLDVRQIAVKIDRSAYVLNPTSCEAKAVTGEAISAAGQVAQLKNRFQVGGCKALDYTPKLSLSMNGATRRSGHPALKAVLTQPSGQANSRRTVVILPPTTFIDQNHIANPCTRPQFAAGNCPPASVLGKVRVFTPLFDNPLEGLVYFRANGGERDLPDVVADLHGKVHVVAVGFVDAVTKKGSESSRVRTTFASLPDAPITKAVFNFKGGKKGVFVNSANLCKVPNIATVKMVAQNNKTQEQNQRIATSCKKK